MNLDSHDTSKLLDELSLSILRKAPLSRRHNEKRLRETFRRRVRRHNNARTNQFEVIERLDGLEEKFQILTLDNLSDALHQRRRELRDFEQPWLPDILDFFLHLAGDPARNENLLRVYRVPPRIGTPPPLRWKDVLADDPIDRNDRLWRVPNFRDTDDSGYDDDDDDCMNSVTSPDAGKRDRTSSADAVASREAILQPTQTLPDESLTASIPRLHCTNQVTETVFVREILFVLRGYSSHILSKGATGYQLESGISVSGISPHVLNSVTAQVALMRHDLDLVQIWIAEEQSFSYIEAMKNTAGSVLTMYNTQVDAIQQDLLTPARWTTASIMRIIHRVRSISKNLSTISNFLGKADRASGISCLDTLFSVIQTKQACGDDEAYRVLFSMLVPSLNAYFEPCWDWILNGELEKSKGSFFIWSEAKAGDRSRLWHDRYIIAEQGSSQPPRFIHHLATRILACGKTVSFIRQLPNPEEHKPMVGSRYSTQQIVNSACDDTLLPFTEAFQNALSDDVNTLLERHTQTLKFLLNTHCGINQTFDAIEQIFLAQNMTVLGEVESKIFDRIDRCLNHWNDRFEIRDMLEAAFSADSNPYTIDAISIQSTFTSSRTMQSRRSSVRMLNALSYGYRLSWPLANIIDEQHMSVYRRVGLMLMQVRRARYSLQRHGYPSAMTMPIDEASPHDQTFAQILAFTLLSFVSSLYDCLTVSIMQPLGQNMRHEMEEALTVDDMIYTHKEYVNRLECACIVSPKLKVIRHSLIAILDLCVRFSDLVSNSAKTANGDSDMEVGSFTSALSRRRPVHGEAAGSDIESDDDGQLGDGYSSFIVLENDTSVVQELRKLKTQYERQLKFFIAGLKGVSKAGQHVQDLATLADRLMLSQRE